MSKKERVEITVKNVRLSYPNLFRAHKFDPKDDNEEAKYRACFILDPETQSEAIKEVKDAIEKVVSLNYPDNQPKKVESYCFFDGNETEKEEYQNMFVLKATSKNRPVVVDTDKSALTEEDAKFYPGCRVDAAVSFWTYEYKNKKGVSANLRGVRFVRDDEPIGGASPLDIDSVFDVE